MWRVGIDVGGTFTDLFAWDESDKSYKTAKVLTTKDDRSKGVVQSIEAAGIPFDQISFLMHGTTTATNSLIERNYPDAAFITTEGFRDTIEIGRQHRKALYDPYQTKPEPLIRRRNRFAIPERMSVKGETRRPLDEKIAQQVAETIAQRGIQSVGIGFINSYANPAHEQRMREIVREANPDVHIVISAETRPIFREHGRFTTTAIRACMMPVMTSYFDRLEDALKSKGFRGSLLILKSNGGVMGAKNAKDRPEELIESGPAGGVAYASYLSRTTHFDNIIHTDVGGTSFDASIVEHGKGLITRSYELEWEVPVSVPMLDIHSVGAGGGSIGWVDEGGSLRVGPRSAGSEPGPACYRRGGTEPTITDANLILGRLNPSLSDKFELDVAAAEMAIDKLAAKIGLSRLETAEGMIRISCETMAQAVKGVVVARARDPRDFVLASFGGAGPMHACFVAQAMNIPKVIIPGQAGVASAFGATAMNIRHDVEAFHYASLDDVDVSDLNRLYAELEEKARHRLQADGIGASETKITRTAQMRYVGQTYEVDTDIPNGTIAKGQIASIADAFHNAHRLEYGVSSDDFPIAFVALGVTAVGALKEPPHFNFGAQVGRANGASRDVYFDGHWIRSSLYSNSDLKPGFTVTGPSIVEYMDSIAVLPPGTSGAVDDSGNLIVTIAN
ncbi:MULTISPECIES: hydantoinase/oxoprolinase family protein [unclassified Mesorhizobium]|uniref:hydantoinase/oxoprolinase family protein n=1 Tax=unclassified Mesorhizobium TaxID=325217 RepID=UPI000FE2DFA2|nr:MULTISPECIES: hydantoinase/oxoprolinase family protein [unclassified Mesorhizobium]TGP21514.1 hydantoinase/oxoprolinase family protein [Mesorhizobium sp. M1D.F.Ca.ET.231.01.1.1]TGP28960.1 hydantoinase/oxoprolinase family protein [Mesorhizobium sp. M1D.F.Ca.ET.234.01.1.1]TGS43429.1 hydantoinase/oxoprolinase family protein [Mesorhizobium sp. M1D.F.Ca.ET.184.01.1.1]TGS59976.1 hydantoinase/oxoprolinase family protein [Mesorhizobium sp. M1D.F.Ca.ET.183.01.1.1]